MSIDRYDIPMFYPGPALSEDGAWVGYNDHMAEVKRLTADLAAVRADLEAKHRAWNHAVEEGARLGRERDEARAERDGLAKALASGIDDMCESWCTDGGRGQFEDCFGCRLAARAALAALPTAPKEGDR